MAKPKTLLSAAAAVSLFSFGSASALPDAAGEPTGAANEALDDATPPAQVYCCSNGACIEAASISECPTTSPKRRIRESTTAEESAQIEGESDKRGTRGTRNFTGDTYAQNLGALKSGVVVIEECIELRIPETSIDGGICRCTVLEPWPGIDDAGSIDLYFWGVRDGVSSHVGAPQVAREYQVWLHPSQHFGTPFVVEAEPVGPVTTGAGQ